MAQEQGRTLAVLFGGVLLGALDVAIVGPALPAIRSEFALSAAELSWIFNTYILCALISSPVLGAWSDRFGRRAIFVGCLTAFGAGSAIVASSPTFGVLIAGRAVQALGAGGLLPVASAVISDTYPENRRGRMLGLIGAVFGVAFVLGPPLAVLLLKWSWRWLFVVNLPLLGVLIPQAIRLLPAGGMREQRRVDLRGAATLAVTLGTAAWLLSDALAMLASPIGRVEFGVLAAVIVVGGFLYFRFEAAAKNPMVSPALLRAAPMRALAVLAGATGFVEATMLFLPTLAVVAFDVDARTASLMLLPLVAALIVGSMVAGRLLDRTGPALVIRTGVVLVVVGLFVLGAPRPGPVPFYVGGVTVGLGLAWLLGAPLRYVAQQIAGPGMRGAAQGVLNVFLGTGRLAGAAMIGGIVAAGDVETDGFRLAMVLVAVLCAFSLIATRWVGETAIARSAESDRETIGRT